MDLKSISATQVLEVIVATERHKKVVWTAGRVFKEASIWSSVERLPFRERKAAMNRVTDILETLVEKGVLERRVERQSIGYGNEHGFDFLAPTPRHLKLSPLQREIMLTLEKAGAESIGTVIATTKVDNRDEFLTQLEKLVRLGLIAEQKRESTTDIILTERGRVVLLM